MASNPITLPAAPGQPEPPLLLGDLDIPNELIWIIAENMDEVSATLLTLTCKTLYDYYEFCLPRPFDLTSSSKRQVVLLLEKDVPSLLYCEHCHKLHPWCANTSYEDWIMKPDSIWPAECRGHSFTAHLDYVIPFRTARLVMNRHLYGPAHGIPVENLQMHRLMSHRESAYDLMHVNGIKLQTQWEARVIDGQLFLAGVRTARHAPGKPQPLRDLLDREDDMVCQHLHHQANPPHPMQRVHELQAPNSKSSSCDLFVPCRRSIKSCPICLTDYRADVVWAGSFWLVITTVYHQLGAIRSPNDWMWKSLCETFPDHFRSYLPGHAPGTVRRAWRQAGPGRILELEDETKAATPIDGETEAVEGQWAYRISPPTGRSLCWKVADPEKK